jgi:hypothetical protein
VELPDWVAQLTWQPKHDPDTSFDVTRFVNRNGVTSWQLDRRGRAVTGIHHANGSGPSLWGVG